MVDEGKPHIVNALSGKTWGEGGQHKKLLGTEWSDMFDRFNRIHSTEIRIFLVFLLVFGLFIHWGGVNSYSRYDLTKAMVEDDSTNIANYSGNTIDKVVAEKVVGGRVSWEEYAEEELPKDFWSTGGNHTRDVKIAEEISRQMFEGREQIYSDKAPLSSILATPAYIFIDFLGLDDGTVWVDTGAIKKPSRTSLKLGASQFLITLTVSVLLGSLLMVLIYRDVQEELDRDMVALVTVIALGLATPLFYYSTTFFGVITASFLAYLSFYLAKRFLENRKELYLFAGGLAGGLAVSAEYYVVIVPLVVLSYLWAHERDWRATAHYLVAAVVGIIPVLINNYLSMGNPFLIPFLGSAAAVCQPYPSCFGPVSVALVLDPVRILNVTARLLFFPTRGLFFYSSVLLIALPGFVNLYRKNKFNVVYPVVFILFLLFNSSWRLWMAGASFGPRYLLPAVPFLALPLAYGIQRMLERGLPWRALVAALLILSFGITLMGFAGVFGKQVSPAEYEKRFSSFQPIKPDLWPERIQGFMDTGPRSPLLEILLGQRRDYSLSYGAPRVQLLELATLSDTFLLLNTAFLPLALLLLVLMLIPQNFTTRVVLGTAVAVLLLLSLTTSAAYVKPPAFTQPGQERVLLDGKKGAIRAIGDAREIASLVTGTTVAFNSSRVNVSVNGEYVGTYRIDGRKKLYLMEEPLRNGANTIALRNLGGCRSPAAYGINQDLRCLSLWVKNISTVEKDDLPSPIFTKGWHGFEPEVGKAWMREKGTLWFNASGTEVPLLGLSPAPQSNLDLRVEVNGNPAGEFRSVEGGGPLYLANISLKSGWNRMTLRSEDGCRIPARYLPNSTDERCLSFQLGNFSLLNPDEAPEIIFRSGWYGPNDGGWRWMARNSEMQVNPDRTSLLKLQIDPLLIERRSRYLTVYRDGKQILGADISDKTNITIPVINRSQNIGLRSREDCNVPAKLLDRSDDTRCLSFRVDAQPFYPENFSAFRQVRSTDHLWRNGSDSFHVVSGDLSGKNVRVSLDFEEPYNDSRPKRLEFLTGGENIANRTLFHSSDVLLDLRGLDNRVKTVEAQLFCKDSKCPRFRVSNVSIVDSTEFGLGGNWYPEEVSGEGEMYRWMSQNATVYVRPGRESLLRFNLSIDDSLSEHQKLSVYVDGKREWTRDIAGEETAAVPVRNSSRVTLHSENGCVVPSRVTESSDDRCLSFRARGWRFLEAGTGLEPPTRYSSPEGEYTRYLFSNGSREAYIRANFSVEEEDVPAEIALHVNGEVSGERALYSSGTAIWPVEVEEGVNTFSLSEHCTGGCSLELEGIGLVDRIPEISYGVNWYPREVADDGESYRWMSQNSTILFRSNRSYIGKISMDMKPFLPGSGARELSAYWNGERVFERGIDGRESMERRIVVRKGINVLRFRSGEGCQRPSEVSGSEDDRCLSFSIYDLGMKKAGDIESLKEFDQYGDARINLTKGWYDREETGEGYRVWSPGNGSFEAWIRESGRVFLGPVKSYWRSRNLTFHIDGRRTVTREIKSSSQVVGLNLTSGLHTLNLTTSGCNVPSEVEEASTDDRCLSVALENLPKAGLREGAAFLRGWYGKEESDDGESSRWMGDTARIFYTSDGSEVLRISASPYPELQNRSLRIEVNGKSATVISGNWSGETVMLTPEPGGTFLQLESLGGCRIPAQVEEDSTDDRCLGFRFDQLSVQEASLGEGWYSIEHTEEDEFLWMENRGTLRFPSSGERMRMEIDARAYPLLPNPSIEVKVNNNSLGIFTAGSSGHITLKQAIDPIQGTNIVELRSVDGCSVPAEMEESSDDQRCLSFDLEESQFRTSSRGAGGR
ncbi:MAG: ArnT family glycosyltransferase [Candidatus Nanohaloarchaea archaeon]